MKKLRVGILFGGRSGEHEVSLLSAASVFKAIDQSKYEVVPIGITREGRWVGSGDAVAALGAGAAALPSPDDNDGAEFDPLFSTSLEHALIGNKLALLGESSVGWFTWDPMSAVDYLLTRGDVDPKRIGCADHSERRLFS